ncbi:hypothetical protein SRL2020226_39500 [Mycobacterium kiyosense]|uniref:DUF732 domain-containing protein n=1 Tax=Mycobacterium kiyosense TaxID=2871094 RepID=A0A9P3Q7I5_9MYCO|nr:hypothetical protein SRL2020028_06690 [Mycobacterium kiyosense]GLB97174.1 hypothetical protein SRL2020226_39500 [Mycobacterium kiyosense]GLD32308.1 hypothetical protein Mkiyose1413_41910 [Mycobacterium kiyosense]GLD37244.1 hypothetical protein Mkiyose1595_34640 [Mycobacterium kiyosense]
MTRKNRATRARTTAGKGTPTSLLRRLILLGGIPLLAGTALLGSAETAGATPADDAYLAQLRAAGLTWPPNADEALIGEAHLICYDLTWGWEPQQIADDIHAHMNARGVTLLDVGTMVNAAHSIYCPGNVCDAPSLCT